MAAEVDDYLHIYKKCIEKLLCNIDVNDQLPVKIAKYNIKKSELVGAILDWTFQLLNQWGCPQSFTISLYKLVFKEIKQLCDVEPKSCGYDSHKKEFDSLKLMKTVIKTILNVCKRLNDNEILSASFPKPESTRFVSMCAIKNHRRAMEDRYTRIDDLHTLFDLKECGPISYYAIFDGHNGQDAAAYGSCYLHQCLIENANYPHKPVEALRQAFLDTDNNFIQKYTTDNLRSGSTALCVLIHYEEKLLYTAWAGDSEAILVKKGKVTKLVNPHKADREDERNRIKQLGGPVLFWGMAWRIFGQLAVSRAIGDYDYKPYVTSEPDIVSIPLDGDEDFVVLACDGLWDSVSPQLAAKVVYENILATNGSDLQSASKKLIKVARKNYSDDNISVIIAFLSDPAEIASYASAVLSSMETTTAVTSAESFAATTVTQNGGTDYHHTSSPSAPTMNGKASSPFAAEGLDDEDDYGPETDVDTVDESSQQQITTTNGSSATKSIFDTNAKSNNNNFDKSILDDHSENVDNVETYDSVKADELVNVDGSLSEESDEEGWKYVEGDKENKEANDSPNCLHGGESVEDMSFSLNPNAVPFIPTSPVSTRSKEGSTTEGSPLSPPEYLSNSTRDNLLNDEIIASSPLKGCEKSLDHVDVPSLDEFKNEICKRPSDITPNYIENHSDVYTGEHNVSFGSADREASNETLLGMSTKAVYGDESGYADNLAEISKDLNEKEQASNIFSTPNMFKFEDNVKIFKEDILEKDTITPASSTTMSLSAEDVQNVIEKDSNNEKSQIDEFSFNDSNVTFGRGSLDFNNGSVVPEFNSVLNNTIGYNEGPDNRKYSDDFSFENYHSTVDDTSSYLTSFKESAPSHFLDFTNAENPVIKSNTDITEQVDDSAINDGKIGYHLNPFSVDVNKMDKENDDLIDKYEEFHDKDTKNEKNLEIGRKSVEPETFLTDTDITNESKKQNSGLPEDELENNIFYLNTAKKPGFYGLEQNSDDNNDYKQNATEYGLLEVSNRDADIVTNPIITSSEFDYGNNTVYSFQMNPDQQQEEKVDEVAENINKIMKQPDIDFALDLNKSFEHSEFKDPSSDVVTSDVEVSADQKDDEIQKSESIGSLDPEVSFETMIYKETVNVENAPLVNNIADPSNKSDEDGHVSSSSDIVNKQSEIAESSHRKKLIDTIDEPLMRSTDAETPYKHDCSRINAEDLIEEKNFADLTPDVQDFAITSIKPDLTCELTTTPDLLNSKVDSNIIIDTAGIDPYQSMFYNEMPESDFKRNDLEEDIYADKDKPESDLGIIKENNDNSTISDQDSTYPLSENHNVDFIEEPTRNGIIGELNNEIHDDLIKPNQIIEKIATFTELRADEIQASHEEKADLSKDELALHTNPQLKETEDDEAGERTVEICMTPPPTPVFSVEEESHAVPEISQIVEDTPVEMEEINEESKPDLSESDESKLSTAAVLAASAVTAVAVGAAVTTAVVCDKTESKKSVEKSTATAAIKKSDVKQSSRPVSKSVTSTITTTTVGKTTGKPKSPASSSTSTTTKKSVAPVAIGSKSSPKQPAASVVSRTVTTKPIAATIKATTPIVTSATTASKPLSTKPKTTTATGPGLIKSGATKSPVIGSTPKPRPASAPVKSPKQTNGDILKSTTCNKIGSSLTTKKSSYGTTTNRPSSSASAAGKLTSVATPSATTTTKSPVSLATRTSLAPKPKTAKTEVKVKSTTIDKKPFTTTGSKDIVSSEKKPLPIKRTSLTYKPMSTSKTTKTDVKSPPVKKMAGSATAVAIRKPSNQTVVMSVNEITTIQNGEVSDNIGKE